VVIFATLAALASAACFAGGSAMQHRVATASSPEKESRTAFLVRLVRRPSWVLGLGLSALAFALHAIALGHGDLALVQPIIVSGIVFTVLIRAAMEHRRPGRATMVWLLLTWAGLALLLVVRPDTVTAGTHTGRAPIFVAGAAGLSLLLLVAARYASPDRRRGFLLAAAAGLLFGLVAGLVKLVLSLTTQGWHQVVWSWPMWALVLIGVSAVLTNQRAYQATLMSVTTPVLNIAQVLVAISFGVVIFGEDPGSTIPVVAGEVLGLTLILISVAKLATGSRDATA
jgi:drug/metabolite transporter (DMT)-like permease